MLIQKFNLDRFSSAVLFSANEFVLKKKLYSFDCASFLKFSLFFKLNYLVEILCVDYVDCLKRYKLVYILQSFFYHKKFFISFSLFFLEKLASFVLLYNSANWLERENFDMFGLVFFNNPDLRKILTDYTFFGHPLKKDFPLTGYFEISFSEKIFLIQEKVCELMQEYRFFQASSSIEDWDLFNLNLNKKLWF